MIPTGARLLFAADLLEYLRYDEESGRFFWRKQPANKSRYGGLAGSIDGAGHRQIRYGKLLIHAHQLVWVLFYREWPASEIDHKDGNPDNNRLDNLRLADRSKNTQNSRIRSDNTSGFKGVSPRPNGSWRTQVYADKRKVFDRTFNSLQEAIAARETAASRAHGEFLRHR